MRSNAISRIAVAVTLAMLLSAQSYTRSDLDSAFGTDTLVISASQHACYLFAVWVAVTNLQHTRGLMHVRELADDAGMIFLYRQAADRSMWMKNTYIPLDILFIRNDGTVSSLVAKTEPLSLRSISSVEAVTAVLELSAGTAERLNIGAGNQVTWSGLP